MVTNYPGGEDYEAAREACRALFQRIAWHIGRATIPYDWGEYGHPELVRLCRALNVDTGDGHLLKQDKRGAWR